METYSVTLPSGQVISKQLPAGASDRDVRAAFASDMLKHGINSQRQAVQRPNNALAENHWRKQLGDQGEISTPERNVSQRLADYVRGALTEIGVDEMYAAHLGHRMEEFLADISPAGNADGFLYGDSDLERQLSILPLPGPIRSAVHKGIRAWHGSPHDFDRFSLDKIGTGEGAQAYGHGLYFAESKAVAENYRDELSRQVMVDGARLASHPSDGALASAQSAVVDRVGRGMSPEDAIKAEIGGWRDYASRHRGAGKNDPNLATLAEERAQKIDEVVRHLEGLNPQSFVKNPGRLYEVNINAKPEDFLDWDRFAEDQADLSDKLLPNYVGHTGQLYNDFADTLGRFPGDPTGRTRVAEEAWRRGIPGIRYLDQGSRNAANGTRNYVVFDDSLIDIPNKY